MNPTTRRTRKALPPPSGFEDHLSRQQAARALGLASEFKVRQLEKEGRLHPVRGAMGSAWYPRAEVLALRGREEPAPGRWSDGQLLALLREELAGRPRTVADLVVEAGVSIARAERIYRFWLAKDQHPVARRARGEEVAVPVAKPSERRGQARLERDALIAQMRDPDPRVRAAAFARLRPP